MSNILDKGKRKTNKVDVRITAPESNKYTAAPKIIEDILRSASIESEILIFCIALILPGENVVSVRPGLPLPN